MVLFKLTLLDALYSPEHGGGEHEQTAHLIKLHLAHNAEGSPKADGHHGRVFEDVVLFTEHQRRDRQSEDGCGGVDHLSEGQLHIVESDVPEGDAGAEGEAQQEHFALGAGGQVLLGHALVPDKPVFYNSYDYGGEHVQSRQEERVSEVVHRKDPFVQAGDGGSCDQPHHHG